MTEYELLRIISFLERVRTPYLELIPIAEEDASWNILLFLIVGVFWVIQAFDEKDESELWWLGLVGGILMLILAFWTAGQLLIDKQYMLLVFAGIWALMQGVLDIARAFMIRSLRNV